MEKNFHGLVYVSLISSRERKYYGNIIGKTYWKYELSKQLITVPECDPQVPERPAAIHWVQTE